MSSDKIWTGRFSKTLDKSADDFNSSIAFDSLMYEEDIKGSICHAAMLCKTGILTESEYESIATGLEDIKRDIELGKLAIDPLAEDIHTFVETELTKRIGENGKKLHTARSRNDQVATDLKLYLKKECGKILDGLKKLTLSLNEKAKQNVYTVMPGYTHLQRAQPITFAQHLLAYCMMFLRDYSRIQDALNRLDYSPLGCCALSGTTYPIDRDLTAKTLGFKGACLNSLDGVSDRDHCVELLSAFSLIMTHLSRLSEELILWSSWEFKFVEFDDAFSTGSSIMPQKKNPDMAELIRGKTGRVYGDLMGTLTMLKGLPLAYNKDMQEDKESIFDALQTVEKCLSVAVPMIDTLKVLPKNMLSACEKGYINATDLADYLVKKGMPFRTAYKLVGGLVAECINEGLSLNELSLDEYKKHSSLFEQDLYLAIDIKNCVEKRISKGSTGYAEVLKQIEYVENAIK